MQNFRAVSPRLTDEEAAKRQAEEDERKKTALYNKTVNSALKKIEESEKVCALACIPFVCLAQSSRLQARAAKSKRRARMLKYSELRCSSVACTLIAPQTHRVKPRSCSFNVARWLFLAEPRLDMAL